MRCTGCGSAAVPERPERTAHGYRRFRCRACARQFNERSGGVLRYKLSLRDLSELFLLRGIVFSHEVVRDWEAKLTPALTETLAAGAARWGAAGSWTRLI